MNILIPNICFKKKLLLSVLLFLGIYANAQNEEFLVSPNIGITTPILDNGLGMHLGINSAYLFSSYVAVEGQISYLHTRLSATFLSGKEGNNNSINVLVGGRLYLNSEEKTNRFYFNLLAGGYYEKEKFENNVSRKIAIGFSSGVYLQLKKILLGLSFDTPQNLIFKIGYQF